MAQTIETYSENDITEVQLQIRNHLANNDGSEVVDVSLAYDYHLKDMVAIVVYNNTGGEEPRE